MDTTKLNMIFPIVFMGVLCSCYGLKSTILNARTCTQMGENLSCEFVKGVNLYKGENSQKWRTVRLERFFSPPILNLSRMVNLQRVEIENGDVKCDAVITPLETIVIIGQHQCDNKDNTLSLIKQSHKTVSCEKFAKGEACEVKWKGKPFTGTIISTGEKENEVKKTMHRLLREVLNEWEGEDSVVPQLLNAEAKKPDEEQEEAGKRNREQTLPSIKRKRTEVSQQGPSRNKTYEEMTEGSSLLDTWRVIQGKDIKDFVPSTELRNVLQQLVKPAIQKEIQEMLTFFASKDESQYMDIEQQHSSSTQSQLSTTYQNNTLDFIEAATTEHTLPISQEQNYSHSLQQQKQNSVFPSSSHALPQPVFYDAYVDTNFSSTKQHNVSNMWPSPTYTSSSFSTPQQSFLQHSSPTTETVNYSYIAESQTPSQVNFQDCQPLQNLNSPIQNTPNQVQPLQKSNSPIEKHVQCPGTSQQVTSTEVRRSPRKNLYPQEPLVAENDEDVKLTGDVKVPRKVLRNALAAALKNNRPAFTLMSKLIQGVFTILELANSRGLGIVKAKHGDTRPCLDPTKIKACKDYVTGWARSRGTQSFQDSELNDAISEQTSYARKKLKRTMTN